MKEFLSSIAVGELAEISETEQHAFTKVRL